MPSEEFMASVMGNPVDRRTLRPLAGRSAVAEPPDEQEDLDTEDPEEQPAEEVEEELQDEDRPPPQDPEEEEDGEAEEQTEPVAQEEETYEVPWDERFSTPEEMYEEYLRAEKRAQDTRAWGTATAREKSEIERQLAEAREALAFASGQIERVNQQSDGDEDFEAWAEQAIEENPRGAFEALRQQAVETGDWQWAYAFTDRWGAEDPYNAANAKNLLDLNLATIRLEAERRGAEPEEEGPQFGPVGHVVGIVLNQLRTTLPDLEEGSPVLAGAIQAISQDAELHAALRSQNPALVSMAITEARSRHLRRRPNGQPRLSSGAQREVAAAKSRATLSDGERPPGPTPSPLDDVPPEMRGAMEHFAKWGMVKEQ